MTYSRSITSIQREPPKYLSVPDNNLEPWLVEQARIYNLRWLLAHDTEGVIWGEVRAEQTGTGIIRLLRNFTRKEASQTLHLSCQAFPQGNLTLHRNSLHQCRLFSEAGELFIWWGPRYDQTPSDNTAILQARLFLDTEPDDKSVANSACIDEDYWLWGWGSDTQDGFIKLVEGTQGIVHAPPLTAAPSEQHRAKLRVRHYLAPDDETGMVQIVAGRCVQLVEPKTKGTNNDDDEAE